MKYLNEYQYYLDLYDLHTIEECLDWYFTLKKGMNEKRAELKDMTQEEFDKDVHKAVSYTINVIKAERYRHRKTTIEEWMERDRKTQNKFDNATPPDDVYCKECFSHTKITSKDLWVRPVVMSQYYLYLHVLSVIRDKHCMKMAQNGTTSPHSVLSAIPH